jgi:hypothetical protein
LVEAGWKKMLNTDLLNEQRRKKETDSDSDGAFVSKSRLACTNHMP